MSDGNDDDVKDLTRIENLSEFLHENDSELDSLFEDLESQSPKSKTAQNDDGVSEVGIDLDQLEDENDFPPDLPDLPSDEMPPEFPSELETDFQSEGFEESNFETGFEENQEENQNDFFADSSPDLSNDSSEDNFFTESTNEDLFSNELLPEDSAEIIEAEELQEQEQEQEQQEESFNDSPDVAYEDGPNSPLAPSPTFSSKPEKFEDVKTFAQNFSYGKASIGGGNPPFSLIARNIKYAEEADDIFILLDEVGIITAQNKEDIKTSLHLGTLLIPQISEYTAIFLAHKLRRFDLDLEVGLADEVHPSKSGETNPRGLVKKENLRQNKTESFNLQEVEFSIDDLIVSTTDQIPGYQIVEYIGVQTAFTIVDEADLEKLHFVEQQLRNQSEIIELESEYENSELSSHKAFKNFKKSFAVLYDDLTMQLKQKAFIQKSNALLNLSFQLTPLSFEKNHLRTNAYQITASAMLAIIKKELD